jgi:hypothetical protein
MLYRPGNVVKIAGRLDAMLMRQRGNDVQARISEIDEQWQQTKAELADKPRELAQAKRRYHNTRRNWSQAPRLFVIASTVEAVSGEPGTEEEARRERMEFARGVAQAARQRRQREEERKSRRVAAAAQQSVAVDEAGEPAEPPAEPIRRRRGENGNGVLVATEPAAEPAAEDAEDAPESAEPTEPAEPVLNGASPVV